jgi:hypothetical protein
MEQLKEKPTFFRVLQYLPLVVVSLAAGLEFLPEVLVQKPFNRWYRAANWAAWVACLLGGALLVGAAVAWIVTGLSPDQPTGIVGVLVVSALLELCVGGFVVGGLAVMGWIAQGTEETQQWARSWGQAHDKVEARPAQEDTSPT